MGHFGASLWLIQCPEIMAQGGLRTFPALAAQKGENSALKRGERFFTKCIFFPGWITWKSPCDPSNILRRWLA